MTGYCNEPEYLMCSVQQGNSSPVFVAVVYRPPHVGLYANKLDEHLRTCGSEFSHKIIMGDLNADLLKHNAETRALLTLAENHTLKIIKHGATHHTRTTTTTSDTHIDVMLVDDNDKVLSYNKFPAPYARNGHDVITATIELFVAEPSRIPFVYRDYNSIRPETLITALAECNWSHFHSGDFELSAALECLNTNLSKVLDDLAPLKTIRPIKGYDPWMDAALISLRRRRDALLRRYLRTKVARHLYDYEHLRDEFNVRYEQARNAFMQTRISHALDTNSNGVWRELRNLGLLPKQREELHGIAPDILNSHFASISTTDARMNEECFDIISKASENGS